MYDDVCNLLSLISERAFKLLEYHQKNNNDSFLNKEIDNISNIQFDIFSLHEKIVGVENEG